MVGQLGPHRLGHVLDLGFFPDIELAAFLDRQGRIVHFGYRQQAGNGNDGIGVQDIPKGQAGPLVVFLLIARKERSSGEGFDPESAYIALLQGVKDAVGGGGLAHGREGETDDIDLREIFDHELDPATVVG